MNVRSIPLFFIGGILPLADYLAPYGKNNKLKNKEDDQDFGKNVVVFTVVALAFICFFNTKENNQIKKGIDAMIKDGATSEDHIYTKYEHGPYAEYRGLKPYMDTRAEVFLKENNHKEDIFLEYATLEQGYYNYNEFMNKYNFKYLLIVNDEYLYIDVVTDHRYEILYNDRYTWFL